MSSPIIPELNKNIQKQSREDVIIFVAFANVDIAIAMHCNSQGSLNKPMPMPMAQKKCFFIEGFPYLLGILVDINQKCSPFKYLSQMLTYFLTGKQWIKSTKRITTANRWRNYSDGISIFYLGFDVYKFKHENVEKENLKVEQDQKDLLKLPSYRAMNFFTVICSLWKLGFNWTSLVEVEDEHELIQ